MKNETSKRQILSENFKALDNKEILMRDFIEMSAANDPNFFRWLFDAEFEEDFDSSLSTDQKIEYQDFIDSFPQRNEQKLTADQIENIISFEVSREEYEDKRSESKKELVDYDDFLRNIAESANDNNGTEEDILFIAKDAFDKMS
jgi:hypothetical protein